MTNDKFQNAEREFFKLKGQFAAGRITSQQFDAALKDLVVEDAQGRYWMLGADSGKWYLHDGAAWIEATPPRVAGSESRPMSAPLIAPPPQPPKPQAKTAHKLRTILLTAAGGLLTLLLGLSVTWGQGALRSAFLGNAATATPTITSTSVFATLPLIVIQTPSVTATSTQTLTPVVIASTQPSPTPIRLDTPTQTTLPSKPTETATLTAVPTSLPVTPTISIAPGLYVTSMRLEPPAPRRGQIIVFYPTFLNTATGEQNPRWLVYIFRRDNLKTSLGETAALGTTIPVGQSEQKSASNWKVAGLNNCEDYIARVAWQDASKRPTFFNKPDGSIFESGFSICP